MAKAPVPGQAKTRLIPLLGADEAARLQCELTLRTLRTACAAAPGRVVLFTAGDARHAFWRECIAGFGVKHVPQSGDHLGQRMNHVLQQLLQDAERVLVIGTDCPALQVADLHAARDALADARMVFVPAEDGGYVLAGCRGAPGPAFDAPEWGSDRVMAQTRAALAAAGWRAQADWRELPPRWDLDRPEDWQRARDEGLLGAG